MRLKDNYILVDKKPVPVYSYSAWMEWNSEPKNVIIKKTYLPGHVEVSTIFLGFTGKLHCGRPLLFETMVFKGMDDIFRDRYLTYAGAEGGHRRAVQKIKDSYTFSHVNKNSTICSYVKVL